MAKTLTNLLTQAQAAAALETQELPMCAREAVITLSDAVSEAAPNAQDEWEERCFNGGTQVTPAKVMVLTLLRRLWVAQAEGSQEQEDAFNTLTDALGQAMTEDQRDRWDSWCLKATETEIVTEAFAILHLLTDSEAKVWPHAYSQLGTDSNARLGTSDEDGDWT